MRSTPTPSGKSPGKNGLTTENSLMNDNSSTIGNRETSLDTFAAELTRAAYCIALRHKKPGSWVDLELDLWKALGETVQRWQERIVPSHAFAQTGAR